MVLKNKSSWKKSIKQATLKLTLEKATQLLPKFQTIAKESVEDLDAVDTGLLRNRTNARVFQRINTIVIQFNTNKVPYAKWVYFGLGTNLRYGPRKFNLISAQKAKQLIKSGSYSRTFAIGAPKKKKINR